MNGGYLINRCYVRFRYNLNERIDGLKSSYENQAPSVIDSIKEKTFKVGMTEQIRIQKISSIGEIFIQAHMRQRSR